MFIPGQNQLEKPQATIGLPYEEQLAAFKQIVIAHIAKSDEAMATQVAETLNNEAELCTKVIEACTVVLQTRIREINEDARQMLAYWAQGNNLDAKVADLGLMRQELSPGDPNAFPEVPPEYESDEHLKLRYFLAPFSFSNAGPGLGYKYHAMTLDERPTIELDSPEPGKVVVTYSFDQSTLAAQVKDATGVRTAPGKVLVTILSRAGDGVPDENLLAPIRHYFLEREDTAPLTDDITISPAEIVPYQFKAIGYIYKGPDTTSIKETAERLLSTYADQQHHLGASIEPSRVDQYLHEAGAVKIKILEPLLPIETTQQQAPYCTGIELEIVHL